MNYYTLKIGGITRELPIIPIGKKQKVASVNLLGDTQLVEALAKKIHKLLESMNFDYFVGPEVKVVPLLHELTRISNKKRYVVCRKNIHGYMVSPVKTGLNNQLVINGSDAILLKSKNIVIVDDVVTTGSTFYAVEKLMNLVGAKVVGKVAVFSQGCNLNGVNNDIIFLTKLPIFAS